MKKRLAVASIVVAGLLLAVAPMLAHHSFAAEFDRSKPFNVSGKVTKVEWMNPHIWIYVDVKGEDGKVVNWALESGSPNGLARRGWTRNSLKQGDEVVVTGSMAKHSPNTGSINSVTLKDGRQVFRGEPDANGNPQ